mmetsp:Transcript_23385/g.59978  ORF Transcript_23385/g.59978 Transcript_23385/m.59978 type:complete len:227 (+) Transcript_23385:317-997(+)
MALGASSASTSAASVRRPAVAPVLDGQRRACTATRNRRSWQSLALAGGAAPPVAPAIPELSPSLAHDAGRRRFGQVGSSGLERFPAELLRAAPGAGEGYDIPTSFPELPELTVADYSQVALPNGLTVFLMEDHEVPMIYGSLLLRGGAQADPPDQARDPPASPFPALFQRLASLTANPLCSWPPLSRGWPVWWPPCSATAAPLACLARTWTWRWRSWEPRSRCPRA